MTLDAPEAQALTALLRRRDGLPRQAQQADDGWGARLAETAAAALTDALRAHGTGAYARVLVSGQVSAGLTPAGRPGTDRGPHRPARRRSAR